MDYLNYGKQAQQKPQQKPQPQGFLDVKGVGIEQKKSQPQLQKFGQQTTHLTLHDFSFGDLSEQQNKIQQPKDVGYVNNEEKKDSYPDLISLFPTPLYISRYPHDYSRELEWIKEQPFRTNDKQSEYGAPLEGKTIIHNEQSKNTFLLDDPIMENVRKFIEEQVDNFAKDIMGLDSEMVITQSWYNRNRKGMQHHEHVHPNSIISGVWYPQIHEQMPPIQFKNSKPNQITGNIAKYNNFNSATFLLPIRNGELILFPSTLQHSVPTNYTNEVRISLSFNTWCKGSLGDISSLTYLPIERCV